MKSKTILLILALAAVIGGGSILYGALKDKAPLPGLVEEPVKSSENNTAERIEAPDFTVQDADGNEIKLSDMLGKPVVLNFWASWCPPCVSEMPEFDKVFQDLGGAVQFMMVDAVGSRGETREDGASFVAKEGFAFPVFFDIKQDAATEYGIRAFPTSIFIDAEGYVVAGVEGAITEATLRKGISLILDGAE